MAHVTKPGGWIAIGAIQYDHGGAAADRIGPEWWAEAAESNEWGWDVEPASVVVKDLESAVLHDEWGPRYCVAMRKFAGDSPRDST